MAISSGLLATAFEATVVFALITGTAAGLLGLLNWEIFRHTAFGRVIAVFSLFIFVYVVYHAIVLLMQPDDLLLFIFESVTYTGLFIFTLAMIMHHRAIAKRIHNQDTV